MSASCAKSLRMSLLLPLSGQSVPVFPHGSILDGYYRKRHPNLVLR